MSQQDRRPQIVGKVARVLNDHELVINRGYDDGVEPGMTFAVMDSDPRLKDIKDPDTKEVLGTIVRETIRLRAAEVEGHVSILETFNPVAGTALNATISGFFYPAMNRETFTSKDMTRPKVQEGDEVAQVLVDEQEES